jgi:hypothetical protein
MVYINRLKTLFHQPSKSFQEIINKPSFLKTSIILIVASVVYSTIAELGMFHSVRSHFTAAYALMFTIIWFLPTLLSMVFFKIIGKKFDAESYIEANALSIFSVLTLLFVFLSAFMIYSNVFAEPRRTAYFAMVYYNQWLPLAIVSAFGAIVIVHRVLKIGRLIVNAKIYQILLIWLVAAAISMYTAYLLFRGWL